LLEKLSIYDAKVEQRGKLTQVLHVEIVDAPVLCPGLPPPLPLLQLEQLGQQLPGLQAAIWLQPPEHRRTHLTVSDKPFFKGEHKTSILTGNLCLDGEQKGVVWLLAEQ
jgi:hypothetical protein